MPLVRAFPPLADTALVLNGTGRLAPTIMGFLNSQRSGQGGPEAAEAPAGQAHGEQYDEQYAEQHQEQDDQYDDWDDAQEDGLGPGPPPEEPAPAPPLQDLTVAQEQRGGRAAQMAAKARAAKAAAVAAKASAVASAVARRPSFERKKRPSAGTEAAAAEPSQQAHAP